MQFKSLKHHVRLALLPLLAGLTAACATAGPGTAPPIFVMRHLHTPAGMRDPDLTAQGRAAADALARMLGGERLRAIYVTDYRRTRQTAAPLAAAAGLVPIVYDGADTPGIAARVRAGPLPALVVGHSNTAPDIVAALGGERPAPLVHEDFGDVWRIEADGRTQRLRIGEGASRPSR